MLSSFTQTNGTGIEKQNLAKSSIATIARSPWVSLCVNVGTVGWHYFVAPNDPCCWSHWWIDPVDNTDLQRCKLLKRTRRSVYMHSCWGARVVEKSAIQYQAVVRSVEDPAPLHQMCLSRVETILIFRCKLIYWWTISHALFCYFFCNIKAIACIMFHLQSMSI